MTQDSTTNYLCSTFNTEKSLCVMLTGAQDNTSSTISTVKPFCMMGSVALQLGVTLVLTVTRVYVFVNLYRDFRTTLMH